MAQRASISQIKWLEQRPRQNPAFHARGAFDDEVRHVWDLCDGLTPVAELVEVAFLGERRTREILSALRESGAILLPGETPEDVADLVADWDESWSQTASGRFGVAARPSATGSASVPHTGVRGVLGPPRGARSLETGTIDIEPLRPQEAMAVAEAVDLSAAEKRRAIAMRRAIERGDPHEILGVQPGATRAQLRAAFLARSKEFHPDRHYLRRLGTFGAWLAEIFDAINAAHQELTASFALSSSSAPARRFQTQAEHAAELFEQACELEVARDYVEALRLFKAAITTDGQMKYLRRGTRCAMSAGDLVLAESLAAQAVDIERNDPSTLRLLAQVYVAQNRLERAEIVLTRAIELATSNDSLHRELRRELHQVVQRLAR